jgi:peptidoglycan/LPS O-acetylase OafA/YrhL
LTSYFKSRVLRLFPGLLVCLLFSAFVLGATVTTLSIGDYFSNISVYKYFIGISLLPNLSPSLPGVFETNPFGDFVNGSLWTLKFEFLLYIAIVLIGKLGLLRKKFVVFWFIATVLLTFPNINADIHNLFMLSSYFCGGILIYLFRDRIKLKGSYAIISLILLLISSKTGCFIALFAIFGTYLVIYVSYQQNFKFYNFAKYGDLSYGIYIYAFPIQQTITAIIGAKITPFQNFIVSLPIIIVLAFMSWHLVEKRALRLKHSKHINNLSISI